MHVPTPRRRLTRPRMGSRPGVLRTCSTPPLSLTLPTKSCLLHGGQGSRMGGLVPLTSPRRRARVCELALRPLRPAPSLPATERDVSTLPLLSPVQGGFASVASGESGRGDHRRVPTRQNSCFTLATKPTAALDRSLAPRTSTGQLSCGSSASRMRCCIFP